MRIQLAVMGRIVLAIRLQLLLSASRVNARVRLCKEACCLTCTAIRREIVATDRLHVRAVKSHRTTRTTASSRECWRGLLDVVMARYNLGACVLSCVVDEGGVLTAELDIMEGRCEPHTALLPWSPL